MKQHVSSTRDGANTTDMTPLLAAHAAVLEKLSHSNNHIFDQHDDDADDDGHHHDPEAPVNMTAPDMAESMLQEMWTCTTVNGESHVHPSTQTYQLVIQTCTRRRHPDAAIESSEQVLSNMVAQYRAGDQRCMPNSSVFVSVLQAYSNRQNTKK
jgi:hypothetical protein